MRGEGATSLLSLYLSLTASASYVRTPQQPSNDEDADEPDDDPLHDDPLHKLGILCTRRRTLCLSVPMPCVPSAIKYGLRY